LGENQVFLGRFAEGIQRLEESVRQCERVNNRSLAGENRYMIGFASWIMGDYAKAQAEIQKSITILAEIGDIWNLSFAFYVAAGISTTWGELGKALDYATRGLGFAKQVEAARPAVRNLINLGRVHRELEDFRGAWQADFEALELTHKGEVGAFTHPVALVGLALDALGLGQREDARTYVEQAQLALDKTKSVLDYPQQVTHARARVCLALGHEAEGDEVIHELSCIVTSSGTKLWRIPALLLDAEAPAAWGDAAVAVAKYGLVIQEAERWEHLPMIWRSLAGLAEAHQRLGEYAEAAAAARRAREIIDRLAATIPDERLRSTFLQSARVQRITALIGS
jgi:tetratricopeptide (TPR) repeat protein